MNGSDVDYNESDYDLNESDTEIPIDYESMDNETKEKDITPASIDVDYYCRITNSIFKNFKDICISMIYLNSEQRMEVINSTFANSTSQYATVSYALYDTTQHHVKNTYVNLHASKSAGAFMVGQVSSLLVDNSTFDNVTSSYDGGVFVVDGEGWGPGGSGQLVINNTEIKNSKSKYGAVLTFYSGDLFIINSTFIDNSAESNALIYVSNANVKIENSTFKNNKISMTDNSPVDRAIIHAFKVKEILIIDNVEFINNSNVFFGCDVEYRITNNNFFNNGRAVYSVLERPSVLDKNDYHNDIIVENASIDTYYVTIINSTGVQLNLIKNTINVSSLPKRYDSRDWG